MWQSRTKKFCIVVVIFIYFCVLDLRWRNKSSVILTLPSITFCSFLLFFRGMRSKGSLEAGWQKRRGGNGKKRTFLSSSYEQVTGMSTTFLDNFLEYGTSISACQTLTFWNQTGCEIFFVGFLATSCSLNIL